MKNAFRCLLAPAVAAACALPAAADAAVDIFLKIDGIPGESTAQKGDIEILAWSWGMSQQASQAAGGVRKDPRSCITELQLTKYVDKASPKLMGALVGGTQIKSAKLTLRKAGEQQFEFFTIELEGILIGMLQDSGSSDVPVESIGLRFTKATVTYTAQKADGGAGEKVPVTLLAPNC